MTLVKPSKHYQPKEPKEKRPEPTGFLKSAYDRPRDHAELTFLDEDGNQAIGKCKQNFKEECDINHIIKTYDKGRGILTHVNKAQAWYGDFTITNEFQEAQNFVAKGKQAFAEIPSGTRGQFENDPGKYLEFVSNPENHDKMVEMGLAIPTPPEEEEIIQKVEIINPTEPTKSE